MTLTQQIITIALCVLGTQLTRFVPFLIFNEHRKTPAFVQYLGKVLPGAIFSMLVVYCLRSVSFRRCGGGYFLLYKVSTGSPLENCPQLCYDYCA